MKISFLHKGQPLTPETTKGLLINGQYAGLNLYGLALQADGEGPTTAWIDLPDDAQRVITGLLGIGVGTFGELYWSAMGAVEGCNQRIKECRADIERAALEGNYRALQAHADTLAFHAKEAAKYQRQADIYQDYA